MLGDSLRPGEVGEHHQPADGGVLRPTARLRRRLRWDCAGWVVFCENSLPPLHFSTTRPLAGGLQRCAMRTLGALPLAVGHPLWGPQSGRARRFVGSPSPSCVRAVLGALGPPPLVARQSVLPAPYSGTGARALPPRRLTTTLRLRLRNRRRARRGSPARLPPGLGLTPPEIGSAPTTSLRFGIRRRGPISGSPAVHLASATPIDLPLLW